MSIKLNDNVKVGGRIVFDTEDNEYLEKGSGKDLEITGCNIFITSDDINKQINKTLYSAVLQSGTLIINGDSVKIQNCCVFCSGNLEDFAKRLAAYCRKACGKDRFEVGNEL